MVENEKITTENKEIIPETILSDTVEITDTLPEETITTESEIKVEEPETITTESEIKVEKPETIKVADAKLTKEQQTDLNKLLEMGESAEDAKAIVTGTYKGKVEKIDFNKSEFEVDKEFLAKDGIDLELSIEARKKGKEVSEQILVDSAGIEKEGGYISAKTLYEMKGYKADKENEITGKIRLKLGFGLDGDQFKENNIKNLLIKQISDSGKYDKEVLANYLDKIEVKTVDLSAYGQKKKGLVYRIPKELGGTNMFSAVDSPKLSGADISDAVADTGPIVASIVAGTVGSTVGPVGTVAASALAAGYTEYARLWYGYHKLGLQNDLYSPEKFNEVAKSAAIKYGLIDAAATGVFLAGAKLILPTILGKSQLSTNTIKEFIETQGKTNTGIFKEVNKVKDQMKKEFNLTTKEADTYFAVSVGKAILDSDQLIKKGSAAQRALLSDEVVRLETQAEFKAIENKILKQTTGLSEVGNKTADKLINQIQKQVKGQANVALREAELALFTNTKQIAKLESNFVNDAATKYLDNFGVYLDDAYRNIQSKLSVLDDSIETGILANKEIIRLDVKQTLNIIDKEIKGFSLKGILPKKFVKVPSLKKGAKLENIAAAKANNKMAALASIFNKEGFEKTGDVMKIVKEGFEELSKKKSLTLKDIVTLKNAVNLLEETATNAQVIGQYRNLSGSLTKNISKIISESTDTKLAAEWLERADLLNLKRNTLFKNFSEEFGGGTNPQGLKKLAFQSENLFNKLIDNSPKARSEALSFGQLIKNGVVPDATVNNIKQALYRNYFNKVIPDASGVAKMSHKDFFEQFGKNYESLLGKDFKKLYNTKSVIKAFDDSMAAVADINGTVAKFLPGIENWSALSNSGPGEIVEHILKPEFAKTMNITKLLQALPTQTVREIRSIFITRMMKAVSTGDGFVPNIGIKLLGGKSTGTLNGAKLNLFLNENRSIISQMFDGNFFKVYRSMGDVLEMLQAPLSASAAKDTSMAAASKNAALFIDMIYGPLNHKRLILNRASRLLDSFGLSQDNLFLFTDYSIFVEAAKKNFMAGNYPAWVGKLPEKERVTFINKILKAVNLENSKAGKLVAKYLNYDNLVDVANLGLNRGAGIRKSFNLLPRKGNRLAPLKNPIVQKEYLEDKYEEIKGEDNMQEDADVFFPIDIAGKYAIKAIQAVFGKGLEGGKYLYDEKKKADKEEKRDIKEEKFREELEN